jgi:hypothetical protein
MVRRTMRSHRVEELRDGGGRRDIDGESHRGR